MSGGRCTWWPMFLLHDTGSWPSLRRQWQSQKASLEFSEHWCSVGGHKFEFCVEKALPGLVENYPWQGPSPESQSTASQKICDGACVFIVKNNWTQPRRKWMIGACPSISTCAIASLAFTPFIHRTTTTYLCVEAVAIFYYTASLLRVEAAFV